jgi:hypothetical protein
MNRLIPLAAVLCLAGFASAHAEESCHVAGPIMSRAAITKSLADRGYTQLRSLSTHNGCYEAKGLDSKGRRFELELTGDTGKIVNAE